MLVLTRKQGESIHIGAHITVTVVRIKHGDIRLGIEAPADVVILRDELLEEENDADSK